MPGRLVRHQHRRRDPAGARPRPRPHHRDHPLRLRHALPVEDVQPGTSCAPRTCRCRAGWKRRPTSTCRSRRWPAERRRRRAPSDLRKRPSTGLYGALCFDPGRPERPMTTDPLFREDAYLRTAEATVTGDQRPRRHHPRPHHLLCHLRRPAGRHRLLVRRRRHEGRDRRHHHRRDQGRDHPRAGGRRSAAGDRRGGDASRSTGSAG